MTQPPETLEKLKAHYKEEPCPTQKQFEAIAKELGAPNWHCVKTYFDQMMVESSEVLIVC